MRVSGVEIVDQRLALEDIWGTRARHLTDQLVDASFAGKRIALMEEQLTAQLNDQAIPSPTQRALRWAEQARGCVGIDELADQSGLSQRQLRRNCLALTGLTPKQLCRAFRFRHAAANAKSAKPGDWSDLAPDCGYYDQAHFINEFRALSASHRVNIALVWHDRYFQDREMLHCLFFIYHANYIDSFCARSTCEYSHRPREARDEKANPCYRCRSD